MNQPKGAHPRTAGVIGLVIKSDRCGRRSVMDECLSGDVMRGRSPRSGCLLSDPSVNALGRAPRFYKED